MAALGIQDFRCNFNEGSWIWSVDSGEIVAEPGVSSTVFGALIGVCAGIVSLGRSNAA